MILGFDFSSLPELPISYLTIVLLAFMLLGLIAGLIKGFGVELLGLIKIAGVVFGSAFAVGFVQPIAVENISFLAEMDPAIQQTVIYVALFIAIWLVLAIIMGLIKRLFLRQCPGGVSKFFGGILGMVKAALFGILVAFIVIKLAEQFDAFQYFVENAKVEPVGKFLVENNPIDKIIELVKELMAKGTEIA